MSSLAFRPSANTGSTVHVFGYACATEAAKVAEQVSTSGHPIVFPKSEAYYWTAAWQAGERETLEALRRGERVVFDSDDATDVVRWLLSDPDDA